MTIAMHNDAGRDIKRTLKRYFLFPLAFALTGFLLWSCSNRQAAPSAQIYGFSPVKAEFNLGDDTLFKFQISEIVSDKQNRLLFWFEKSERASRKKLGSFFRITSDGGATFGAERKLPETLFRYASFAGARISFVKERLASVCVVATGNGRNLFYTQSNTDGAVWSEPVQINDEQDSAIGLFNFIQPSEKDVYCIWLDRRRGFSLVFVSASHDGGRTWSPNQALEYDFREGEQTNPVLTSGAGGRLLAFWVDARDRQTLRDIRCSYSDDGGQHWSPSQKINDDTGHVWQGMGTALARGNKIYVVFEDFREVGEGGDNDWNIYFTKSDDNGATWSRNVRLNDVQEGEDSRPILTVDGSGTLYCVWRSTRRSIFGDIHFAHSADGGNSWSSAIRINEGDQMVFGYPASRVTPSGSRLLTHWTDVHPEGGESRLAWLEALTAPLPSGTPLPTPTTEPRARAAVVEGDLLFADDFSRGSKARWEAGTGAWTLVEGAYMGVEPGAEKFFSSFARFKEPERYILRARFKLDGIDHRMANLYFRVNASGDRYYVIGNSFRIGACLGVREDDKPTVVVGAFALQARPLAERRFAFRGNRWYEVVLHVTPTRVDYFVDGSLMLSYDGRLQLPPGRIGIGGFSSAPAYFDDIAVYQFAK